VVFLYPKEVENMGIPQIIMIVWIALSLGVALARHGEYHDGKYNFFVTLIVVIIEIFVLYRGGFFTGR
jgi:hypothetical protein